MQEWGKLKIWQITKQESTVLPHFEGQNGQM